MEYYIDDAGWDDLKEIVKELMSKFRMHGTAIHKDVEKYVDDILNGKITEYEWLS